MPCQVASIDALGRRAGDLRSAVSDGLNLHHPLLSCGEIKKSAARRQQLLHLGFFQILLGRLGHALRRLGAQAAFVSALPDPVDAYAFVNAFFGNQITVTHAVLQVDRPQFGRQGRERRPVRRKDVGPGSRRIAAGHGHIVVVERGIHGLFH